ncbi:PH domain-containing protein [Pseudonocardia sulfidoxydans]|uniref:PH domain-containing protein n=1 Tax=Pseudonocardia sulfidoxydans TaxID=54011 RepID=UPI0027D98980|nr:PH domain-containing protein [Pseudonocardia sulfidoxydans]
MGTPEEDTVSAVARQSTPSITLRPRRVLRLAWIGSVLVVALFVAIAIVLRNTDTGVYFRFADQVSMVLLGLLIAAGLLLLARPRVRADAEGIEVRNILQTRRFGWGEIVGIAFPDGASWARLDLPDDEYLPVLAVQAVDRMYAVEGIRELRALRNAAHARLAAARQEAAPDEAVSDEAVTGKAVTDEAVTDEAVTDDGTSTEPDTRG